MLLVEDTPEHVEIARATIAEANRGRHGQPPFVVEHAARLADALTRLGAGAVDVVLLDLHLPDSHGLDTFRAVRAAAPDVPVVVASALDDEALAVAAVREGAQDYLVKGEMVAILARSLRYAIERKRVELALVREHAARAEAEAELRQARRSERRRRERQTREMRSLEELASAPGAAVETARAFGVQPLSQAVPHRFAEMVERYREMLDLALDERTYKVQHHIPDALRALAADLSFLNAGPRDVIELHTTALKQTIAAARRGEGEAMTEEARMLVVQLMGYLVTCYRG
jgi:DNA-binding response OmpR family regulator